jgi:hypothetical protein
MVWLSRATRDYSDLPIDYRHKITEKVQPWLIYTHKISMKRLFLEAEVLVGVNIDRNEVTSRKFSGEK